MLRSFLIIFIGCIASPFARGQSITVGLPSASSRFSCSVSGTTISGFSCPFTVAISSAPSLYSVEDDIDGEITTPSGTATGGIVYAAPYSSLFYVGNGRHAVVATMRDALNNTIGSPSAAVPFSVENDMPQNLPGTNCGSDGGAPVCTDITVTPSLLAGGADNFALNNTVGGGAGLKTAGFPGTLQSGGTGFRGIGVLQSPVTPASPIAQ
jgi:hypothetical protein